MVATNDDNMHDPRRPEVPEMGQTIAAVQALHLMTKFNHGLLTDAYLAEYLRCVYSDGVMAGMAAQYKHDQEAGK